MLKIKIHIILTSVLISFNYSFGQINKKDFADAEYSFEMEDYNKALSIYKKFLSNDPENSNLNYKVGMCLFKQQDKKRQALPYFEKAIKNISVKYKEGNFDEKNAPVDALLYYGNSLLIKYRIKEAREAYQRYEAFLEVKDVANIDNVNQRIYSCDIAEEMIRKKVPYVFRPLPEPINLSRPQYDAVLSGDGADMAFLYEKNERQGIYFTQKKGNKWSYPIDITTSISIDPKYDKFTICSMSADGKRLYVWINNELETGLFVTTLKSGKWRNCEMLNSKINSIADQTHCSESPDGTQLYFTSNRKGGFGNLDIYVSTLNEKNQWGKPENLGDIINTPFNEETPFISADNQRLYFSSEGHKSMGGYDFFVSKRISGNEWSEPQNIGFPISTTDDDLFFVPVIDAGKAFCALRTDSNLKISLIDFVLQPDEIAATIPDILPIEAPVIAAILDTTPLIIQKDKLFADTTSIMKDTLLAEANLVIKDTIISEPNPEIKDTVIEEPIPPVEKIMFLRGRLTFSDDSQNMEIIDISIYNNNKEIINTLKPASDGNYIIPLKPGAYYVEFSAIGYTKITKPVFVADSSKTTEVFVDGLLHPESLKAGEYVSVRSILFNYNSLLIDREGKVMLERLIRIMKDYPALSMEIIGHADSKGNPVYNRKISLDRAKAVSDYFISRGIDPTRFVVHGFGDVVSVAKNVNEDGSDNPFGRRFNRRAEIRLLNCTNLTIVNEEISIPENLRVKDSYEYYICIAESDQPIDKSSLKDKVDTSLLNIAQVYNKYVCTYSAPTSKGDALLKLRELNEAFPEAYLAPQIYFTFEAKRPQTITSSKYTIQLVALQNYLEVSYFNDLQNVVHHKGYDGLNRYTWGSFNTYYQASSLLKYVQKKGYSDAFVVPVSKFNNNVEKTLTGYTVQIFSSVKEADTSMFKAIPKVILYKGIDKFYRYATGNFETHFEAVKYLNTIKKKGFPNASIRRISDLTE